MRVCFSRLGGLGLHGQHRGVLIRLPAALNSPSVPQQPDVRPTCDHRHPQSLPAGGICLYFHHVLFHCEFEGLV